VKTISLKKVSAVAVASLAIGGFSPIAPANAGTVTAVVTSISLKSSTTTPTQGVAMAVNFGAVIPAQSIAAAENVRFQAAFTSVPTGGSTSIAATRGLNGVTANITTAGSIPTYVENLGGTSVVVAGGGLNLTVTAGTNTGNVAGGTVTASASAGMGSFAFTPQKAGTYVMTVWQDGTATPDGLLNAAEVSQTISIVVAAATGLSVSSSYLRLARAATRAVQNNPAVSDTNFSTTEDAVPRSASIGADATVRTGIGKVAVFLINADGTAAGANHTVDCQVTGSGLCVIDESGTANVTGGVRAFSFTNTGTKNVSVVHLITDGTAGTGTVTIAVTDSVSGTRTVIGTKSFSSFGAVKSLAVSTKNYTIGRAGYLTGKAATARVATSEIGSATLDATTKTVTSGTSTTPAFIVKATDSLGNAATAAADPTIVSSNAAAITGGTCVLDDGSAGTTYSSSTNGVGFYNCDFATAASATSGSKATLTIRIVDPADATLFITTTIDVTVGGSISTEVLSLDKLSYATGEAMTVTRTAKDSSGNPVYDGAVAPAVTFTKAVGGTAPGASIYVGGTVSSTSAGVVSVYAPSTSGAFSALATSSNTAKSALTAAATVVDGNAGLLTQIDALNAKIVALNALIAKIMKKLGVK